MTSTGPEAPDLSALVREMMPWLRRQARLGWIKIGTTAVLSAATFGLMRGAELDGNWYFFAGLISLLVIYSLAQQTRRVQEKALMPHIARAFGLDYSANGVPDLLGDDTGLLLPKGTHATTQDGLEGDIGGRALRFGEVKVEQVRYRARGRTKRIVLFNGIVGSVSAGAPLPPFRLIEAAETEGGILRGPRVRMDDETRIKDVQGPSGKAYAIFIRGLSDAPLDRVERLAEAILSAAGGVGAARLYSATATGETLLIALRHEKDMFRLGGLFVNEDRLRAEIEEAYEDVILLLNVAKAVFQAEAAAHR